MSGKNTEVNSIKSAVGISFFDVIVSAEYVKRGKPNPEGLLLTLRKLNQKRQNPIAANQCIVIEDSHWGLKAAKDAGMHSVAVTNSYEAEKLTLSDQIVDELSQLNIDELHKLIEELKKEEEVDNGETERSSDNS